MLQCDLHLPYFEPKSFICYEMHTYMYYMFTTGTQRQKGRGVGGLPIVPTITIFLKLTYRKFNFGGCGGFVTFKEVSLMKGQG